MEPATFGQYLLKKFYEWQNQNLSQGRLSQNDFAKYLGVPNTSLSVWINEVRKPEGKNADLLADKLGPEVYDYLGMPRRMPANPKLAYIASLWPNLPQDKQDELYEIAQKMALGVEKPSSR